jgi:hypothetical protein
MGGRGGISASGSASGYGDATRYIDDTTVKPYSTISRKQANVLYRAYKDGRIRATAEQMNTVYNRYVHDGSPSLSNDSRGNDVANRLRSAVNAASHGDFRSASQLFDGAIRVDAQNFRPAVQPATAKRATKKTRGAKRGSAISIEKNPNHVGGRYAKSTLKPGQAISTAYGPATVKSVSGDMVSLTLSDGSVHKFMKGFI